MSNRYSIYAQTPDMGGGLGNPAPAPSGGPNVPQPQPQPIQPIPSPMDPNQAQQMPEDDREAMKEYEQAKKRQRLMAFAIAGIVVLVAIGIGYYVLLAPKGGIAPVTSTSTTSVAVAQVYQISACQLITKPGTYYLTASISTSISSGACLTITSPNVTLIGNGNRITGNGPFVDLAPYTYGILLSNVTSVIIKGVSVSKFSYDIYFNNSNSDALVNSSAGNGTISGIYFSGSSDNRIVNDSVTGAESNQGAINLQSGSAESILNDVVQGNAFYGIVVNTKGNTFSGDTFLNNPVDLFCAGPAAYKTSNNFSSSRCSVNQFCDFASCSTQNLPSNLSAVVLGSKVTSCGGIQSPGVYTLQNDLNLSIYENISSNQGKALPCITIGSSNVRLDCDGYTIFHAGYGVSIPLGFAGSPAYNVSVVDCNFKNDTTGVGATSALQVNFNRLRISGGRYGFFLTNVTTGAVNNTQVQNATYGVYLNGTYGVTFLNTSTKNNEYGIFVYNGSSNLYQQSTFSGNSKQDVYCSASTYGSQGNIFQNNACGSTDCQWAASCSTHTLPPVSVYPLTSCGTISTSGNYSLAGDVVTQGNCFRITASNVTLNCDGKKIVGIALGSAFVGSGVSNVTIADCEIYSFRFGFNFTGGNYITIKSTLLNETNTSVTLTGSSYDSVLNDTTVHFSDGGFVLSSLANSIITNDSAEYSLGGSDGFDVQSLRNDVLQYDTATGNEGYGFSFAATRNNIISNNTADSNVKSDYICDSASSGFFADQGGVNYGVTKQGCVWLVAVPPNNLGQQCAAFSTAGLVSLSYDMVYPYGSTCFNIYRSGNYSANSTVVNCNGHTVYAPNGGTFVHVGNATGVTIKNCYLKGFTSPIVSSGDNVNVFNNTIDDANVSIALLNEKLGDVKQNSIFNSSYGIFFSNVNYGTIKDNNLVDANVSISLFGGIGTTVANNNATGGSVGFYFAAALENVVQDNIFSHTSTAGAVCASGSQNSTSANRDLGGNVCSNNVNCNWMTSSAQCAP